MSKHTEGPWVVCNGGRMVATSAEGANGWELCDVRDDVYGYQHNAALIAAAPDLLEALECVKQCGFDNEDGSGWGEIHITRGDWNIILASIAKARGEAWASS